MNRNRFAASLTILGVMAAFAVAPGASGSQCPERAGHRCNYGDTAAGSARSESPAQQRPRLQPSASRDRNGNAVWRVGSHVMY